MKLTTTHLIEKIQSASGGTFLLNPKQLEELLGISAKQQSKLRKEGRSPIPFKNIGRLVCYSIYDVADFLLNSESTTSNEVPKQTSALDMIPKKRLERRVEVKDLSHVFLLHDTA